MGSIQRETVEKVARLAHIHLSEEELVHYQGQLGRVLQYMEQIQEITDQLPETWRSDLSSIATPERSDVAYTSGAIEKVLQTAPKVVGTAFQVPRIID